MISHGLIIMSIGSSATAFMISSTIKGEQRTFAKPSNSVILATSQIDDRMVASTTSTQTNDPFANFDYENHWYPVIWECDLEMNEPTKVTVFDVDYVVAKVKSSSDDEQMEVIAMKDFCTHKGAALSQGRITEGGNFQCAYHGWTFSGKTGDCIEIPQIIKSVDEDTKQISATIPSRACTDAVPAQIHQGMVWLFPGGGLEKALLAPPPPSIPEFDNMKLGTYVRDMPVDFSILLSNICDPDHGLFAHQEVNFDPYTASLDCPFEDFQSVETYNGLGWTLKSKIDSKAKLTQVDQSLRDRLDPKRKKSKKKIPQEGTKWATTILEAPAHVRMQRVDKESQDTKFISVFYVCPVGVGRSRFFGGGLGAISIPRWINFLMVSNFVDQDTYLLATQQKYVLAQEADDLRTLMEENGIDRSDLESTKTLRMRTRRNMFCLPSPTDRISSKLDQFWDSTLVRCPNRAKTLLKLDESGKFLETPTREFVLDRKTQNLDICLDSQGTVRNCKRAKKITKILSVALFLSKCMSLTTPSSNLFKSALKSSSMVASFGLLYVVSFLANKLEKEYYFKYTDDMRRDDMAKIPKKIWIDR